MNYDVFISYSSKDYELAALLVERLKEVDGTLKIWIDKERLEKGFDWYAHIKDASESSRVILPVLTPNWRKSKWTKFETYGADKVIPLIFKGQPKHVLTAPLARHQAQVIDLDHATPATWQNLAQSIQRAKQAPVPQKMERLFRLPLLHNPNMVGCENNLNAISEILFAQPTADLTQGRICAITARAGCGKTAIAREYAERFWRCYQQILWIDCRVEIASSLAALYPVLLPAGCQDVFTDHEKARRVLAEFKNPDAPLRLLIYDGALNQDVVLDWLPNTGSAHTIITSCYQLWTAGIQTRTVQLLDARQARDLLLRMSQRNWAKLSPSEQTACEELAKHLDYLPLTLVQAGACISQEHSAFGFSDYLRLCKAAGHRRLHRKAQKTPGNSYPYSAYDTWYCTASRLSAGPRALLRLASFLAPAPIPLALFTCSPKTIVEMGRMFDPKFTLDDDDSQNEADIRGFKTTLASYAMISLLEDDCFSLDRLLLEVERQETPPEAQSTWTGFGLRLFAEYAPGAAHQTTTWPVWRVAFRHVQTLMEQMHGDDPAAVPAGLLTELASFLNATGRFREALAPAQLELALQAKRTGSNPATECTLLDLIGTAHLGLGQLQQAEDHYQRALEGRTLHLGAGHRHTLASQSNLAGLFLGTQRIREAEQLFRQSWEGCLRHPELGPAHEETACSALGLAAALVRQSRDHEAAQIYEDQLRECRKLGLRNRVAVTCMSGLAPLLEEKGEMMRAEALYHSACMMAEAALGADNPATSTCRENFASYWLSQNHPEKAIALYGKALEGRSITSDIQDADTYDCLHRLAMLLEAEGRSDDAHQLRVHHLVTWCRAQRQSDMNAPVLLKLVDDIQCHLLRCGRDRDIILDELNDILRPFNYQLQSASTPSDVSDDQA